MTARQRLLARDAGGDHDGFYRLAVTATSAGTGLAARLAAEPPTVLLGVPDGMVLRAVDAVAEALVAALLGELIVVLGNVFARVYLHHSFRWADEVARLTLSTLAFTGGAVAYRRREHAFVRVVLNLCSKPTQHVCMALADVLVLFVAGITGIASPRSSRSFARKARPRVT
jgi:hypothetical protein